MEPESALMTIILPVTYIVVDMLKAVPKVPSWSLPMLSALIGMGLGIGWAWGQGATSVESLMVYGAVGFAFGSGATGVNQIRAQAERRADVDRTDEPEVTA